MPAFLVATVHITNAEAFAAYRQGIAGLSEKHGGESVLNGVVTAVIEGDTAVGERVVVLRFPTTQAAEGFIGSADYQAAKALRLGGAEVKMRIVEI